MELNSVGLGSIISNMANSNSQLVAMPSNTIYINNFNDNDAKIGKLSHEDLIRIVRERKQGFWSREDTERDFYRCIRCPTDDLQEDIVITMNRKACVYSVMTIKELKTQVGQWRELGCVSYPYNVNSFTFADTQWWTFVIQDPKWTEENAIHCPLFTLTGIMVSGFTYITKDKQFADMVVAALKNEPCSLCDGRYYQWGHNAQPLNDGRCCDACNTNKVIPARLGEMSLKKTVKKLITKEEADAKKAEAARKSKDIILLKIKQQKERAIADAESKAAYELHKEEMRQQRIAERQKVCASAGVSIAELTVAKPKEDDEAKEIRKRAAEKNKKSSK